MQNHRKLSSKETEELMIYSLSGAPSLFRYHFLKAISSAGKESICFNFSEWYNMGPGGSSSSHVLRGLNGKTIYDALFRGLHTARDKAKRREEVKEILGILIKHGAPECAGTELIPSIIYNDFGYDLAIDALKAGASPVTAYGTMLDSAFYDMIEGKEGALEFIREVVKHPKILVR